MMRLVWLLLIPGMLALALVKADQFPSSPLQVGPFVDPEQCYPILFDADKDGDRRIVADEFIFVAEGFGYAGPPADDFNDLPPLLRATFRSLACLCQVAEGNGCCVGENAHISNLGTGPDETPTDEQAAYLFTVCQTTSRAVEQANASIPPSFAPTFAPSPEPTESPTFSPTGLPTETPSAGPTVNPTDAPTFAPSETPTDAPTSTPPSEVPTAAPSSSPSDRPSPGPGSPTIAPTTSEPSLSPSTAEPTPVPPPTESPSIAPSGIPLVPVSTSYLISVGDGIATPLMANETALLEEAMDSLAVEVAGETFPNGSRIRRRLVVKVSLPTTVTGFIDQECSDQLPDTTSCHDVTASISLATDEDEDATSDLYVAELEKAINQGRLQDALVSLDANTRVTVQGSDMGQATPSPTPVGGDGGLSSGATAGIAVAAVVGVLAAAGLFVMRRRGNEKEDPFASQQALASQESTGRGASAAAASQLGASEADYGKRSKKSSVQAFDTLDEGEREVGVESAESSSNAGSSGWSSSAGVSSLNTGSADESLDYGGSSGGAGVAVAGGATLAAIGVASAMSRDGKGKPGEGEPPGLPTVSRDDLDAAIEAGDWAAVGATAALLAAGSDSQSQSSRSRRSNTGSSTGGSNVSSVDAARAAELDHLVDAGDWEGVVLAAAKFEAAEDDASRSGGSSKSQSGSRSSTGPGSSAFSASETSESQSKIQKRAEIRAEVESLVRRVVPEEIDNVDEMMTQFKGREEELVETLRTMQERAVAQKARVAGQKTAKREARLSARQGAGPPAAASAAAAAAVPATEEVGLSPAAAAGVSAGVAAALGVAAGLTAGSKKRDEASHGSGSGSSPGSASSPSLSTSQSSSRPSGGGKRRRTALELAIEAGDWEAVGEAAAMMGDASQTTENSGEMSNLVEDDERLAEARRLASSGVNAERAKELDEMIDRGDWTGVVTAASRFSKADAESLTEASSQQTPGRKAAAPKASDTDSYASLDKDKALKEEHDALAQAEIWMAIAEQSKTEGSTDMAASDAADWAIARSLSALRSAEERGDLKKKASKTEPPSESVDDQSV